jgi:hypothetical protein
MENERELLAKMRDIAARAKVLVLQQAPVRTGNLANSIKVSYTETGFKIFIDTNQAPYATYTINPWLSERWKGRANPNEGWFEDAANIVARYISTVLHATSKKVE